MRYIMDENSIDIDINTELLTEAQTVLNSYGVDVNTVVSDYLKKIVNEGYEASIENPLKCKTEKIKQKTEMDAKKKAIYEKYGIKEMPSWYESKEILPRSEVRGILKGKVWMADDFDAPLDDLDDYE